MKRKQLLLTVLSVIFISCTLPPDEESESQKVDKNILFDSDTPTGCVNYDCEAPFSGKKIDIYYHIPDGDLKEMPVQIVMHGMDRNGDGYRDAWINLSDKYGFILLCPCFTKEQFPDNEYQLGNVTASDGSFNAPSKMTYVIIDRIFDFFVSHSRSNARKYNIYGHSAGSQFVHRFLLFNGTPKVEKAVAANAGWYTFPTDTAAFPYGIGDGVPSIGLDLKKYYAKHMTVLLGEADTTRSSSLRQSPEADAQGRCRLERGKNFFEFCRKDAAARGYEFNWKLEFVPGVAHSNKKMAPKAAELIYGKE